MGVGGSLTKTGSGTFTITGTNTYTGGTIVSAGTLLGTTTSIQGDVTNSAALEFNQTTAGTYSDLINGAGTVTIDGGGTVEFMGANTYTGQTIITSGTLISDHTSGAIPSGSDVTMAGAGTFDLQRSDTVRSVAGSGDVNFSGTTPTLTVGGGAATLTGIISGDGNLATSGTATWTLSGANTFDGTVTVGGTGGLVANGGNSSANYYNSYC